MTTAIPLSEFQLVGYIGRYQPKDWPLRLLPVYSSPSRQVGLLPPVEENGETFQGKQVPLERLEDLEEEGELTRLPEPKAARSNYLLWMDEAGPLYMPREEVEKALDERCLQTITRAMEAGLNRRVARENLFRSLRARPTALAFALLSLHFQKQDDFDQVKPLREDLASMARSEPTELEQRLAWQLPRIVKGLSRNEVTAVAMELHRARRETLARGLLDAAQIKDPYRRAAQPAPELGWATVGRVRS
ncbi:hypothetical protein [Archangium sp.]|uniref:hypothetical protein n=1 Tax=Archangium sp. TaxID=1872627 RepID=UPI00286AD903|nr:hypothetical protein [Archangium sp.]